MNCPICHKEMDSFILTERGRCSECSNNIYKILKILFRHNMKLLSSLKAYDDFSKQNDDWKDGDDDIPDFVSNARSLLQELL